ncbi:MAG: PAQR family membrane homeostasis protein TrhA [Nocardioidaceae bacterium]
MSSPTRPEGPDNPAHPVEEAVEGLARAVRPHLRGWLHAGTFPLAVAAGIVLVVLADGARATVAAAVYATSAALLFGVSAIYHCGHWSPRTERLLKRLDHSNIFLIIAGTYTPFSLLLLDAQRGRTLLWIVWAGALAGIAFRVLWVGAPRWLYTPVYIALGWVAVLYLPDILRTGGVAVVTLLAVGGALYSLGALVYATKRPDPSPRWFGFHEVFHALTLAAYVAHYVAVSIATYTYPG